MKKFIILFCVSWFSIMILQAQLRKLPAVVTDSLSERFPSAKKVSWKDNLTNYEASFTFEAAEWSAKFSSKGEWLQTTKLIKETDLNEEIKDGFQKSKYNDWEVKSVEEIQEKNKEVIYRIMVRKSSLRKMYLYFNKKGQLQKEGSTI